MSSLLCRFLCPLVTLYGGEFSYAYFSIVVVLLFFLLMGALPSLIFMLITVFIFFFLFLVRGNK